MWTVRYERPFLVLALFCVCLMPSTYKGGASVPHAHSFFQFWFIGVERAFDHHHGIQPLGGDKHEHHHLTQQGSSAPAPLPSRPFDPPRANDEVNIAPETAPGGIVSAIVLLLIALMPALRLATIRWRFPRFQPVSFGIAVVPESPPPRTFACA